MKFTNKIKFLFSLTYLFNVLFCNRVLFYFAKPKFIVYEEWFANNFKKLILMLKIKKQKINEYKNNKKEVKRNSLNIYLLKLIFHKYKKTFHKLLLITLIRFSLIKKISINLAKSL